MLWGFAILVASCFSFYGGLCIYRLRNYSMARMGSIVACIPCLGPCCLLGIPFGAWSLMTLNRPEVRYVFED